MRSLLKGQGYRYLWDYDAKPKAAQNIPLSGRVANMTHEEEEEEEEGIPHFCIIQFVVCLIDTVTNFS